jgi:hypothetical protein
MHGFSGWMILAELWPFDKKVFFSVCCQIHKSLSRLLLKNYWCNFIQTLQKWSVPSLVVHCLFVTKLVQTWNWPLWGDTCDYWSLLLYDGNPHLTGTLDSFIWGSYLASFRSEGHLRSNFTSKAVKSPYVLYCVGAT